MKTLEQIKNDYADELGYMSWKYMLLHFVEKQQGALLDLHFNEVMILAQKECLKRASENFIGASKFAVDTRNSITNKNNIIK